MHQGHPHEMMKPEPQGRQDMMQLYKYGHPPLYGGGMGNSIVKYPKANLRRKRLNVCAIFICLFVPWLLFCFLYWLISFQWFYRQPAVCVVIAVLALAFVGYLGFKAYDAVKKSGDHEYEHTWYIFLFLTSLLAWCLALYAGYHLFYHLMEPYYGIANLGKYAGVDPHLTPGEQLMDSGHVVFKPGTHLDLSKSMSFRNNDIYCVAPIVTANYSVIGAPKSFDYWAVGTNCCCGDTIKAANFQCGEYMNPKANAGLRLMKDVERPFYRLAVQQAIGAYGIRANHPLFFHWVQDPVAAEEAYNWEGHRQYLIGAYSHFAFQLLAVCLATCAFFKIDG